MKNHRVINWIINSALIIFGVAATILLYWIYSPPQEAISVSPNPITVVNKVVKDDGSCESVGYSRCVVLRFTRCKNVRSQGRVVITVVGEDVQFTLPVLTDNEERRCENDKKVPFPIPPQVQPGEYTLHFRTTFRINPLTIITQDFDSESFRVE